MGTFHYRLLFIDDEPLSRELFQSSLSAKGYEVCVAKDGFAAQVRFIVEERPEAAGLPVIKKDRTA